MLKKPVTRRDFVKGVAVGGSLIIGSSLLGCAEKKPTPTPTPGETPKPTPTAPKKPIKIGALEPLSGPFASWGDPHLKGLKMAVEEINSAGGVLGTKLEVVERDTKNNPSEAATTVEELAYQEGVVAITGIVSSGVGLATGKKAEEVKVPLFLHMAGSDAILTKNSRYTFRTALSPAPALMQAFAEFIKNQGFKRVGAVIADYAWGHACEKAINKYIVPLEGVEVHMEVAPVKETDFTSYLRKLQEFNPEFIIATSHPPGTAKIVKQGMELGLNAKYIGPNFSKKIWESAIGEKLTQGVLDISPVNYEHPAFTELGKKFVAKYNEDLDFAGVTGYVNAYQIADAIKRANSSDPKDVATAIRTGSFKMDPFAYPLSYTEWGDLKEAREVIVSFAKGGPSFYPSALTHFKVEFITPPLTPPEPSA